MILRIRHSLTNGRAVSSRAPDSPPAPLLKAENVTLSYFDGDRTTCAVASVTVEIPERGFVGVMGPSGSGKSSLLYLLSGLKRPTEGEVSLDGIPYRRLGDREMTQLRRERFGFVFQLPFLLNYLTARENVLAAAKRGDRGAARRADEILDRLQIGPLADRFPYNLSGGERQRVCVARALINDPQVIFADEPTASLDHLNGHAVVDLLSAYREQGVVIVVTHDPEMLVGADHIFRMRDGSLEE